MNYDEIFQTIENGIRDVYDSDRYRRYLETMSRFHAYSLNNCLLIFAQKPEATLVAGYQTWRKRFGRHVRYGEKGIRILAPAPYKMQKEQDKMDSFGKPVLDKDGEPVKETVEVTVNAFKPVSTFDITQTEGDPVPTVGVNVLTESVEG